VFNLGKLFDAFALLAKLGQQDILLGRKPGHPPETDPQQMVPANVIQKARLFSFITNVGKYPRKKKICKGR
jgi:hypothetical protein